MTANCCTCTSSFFVSALLRAAYCTAEGCQTALSTLIDPSNPLEGVWVLLQFPLLAITLFPEVRNFL